MRRDIAAAGEPGREAPQGLFLLIADDAVVVAASAGVGLVGRAAGQDLAVGSRHMGVGSDHQRSPAVAEMAHGHLLGSGLAMHVDDDGVGGHPHRTGGQFLFDGTERAVHRVHVDAAQHIHDQHGLARLGLEQIGPGPGGVHQAGIVGGADQARLAHDIGQSLALVPAVVAQRQTVRPGHEQLARRVLGNAETTRGVLGIDHYEIEFQVALQARQVIAQPVTSGLADDITEKSQSHAKGL